MAMARRHLLGGNAVNAISKFIEIREQNSVAEKKYWDGLRDFNMNRRDTIPVRVLSIKYLAKPQKNTINKYFK